MLDLPDHWVWDFWLCRDADRFHAFFLKAPRSLGDPELRHRNASVGHAVSEDLVSWTRWPDALDPQPSPAYDDLAVWTGSVVADPAGGWRMFTTGLALAEDGLVQRIGVATSDDLLSWRRDPAPVLEADPRWYATVESGEPETHWRDPWVFHTAGAWHLLATAKSAATGGAVVAHAVSSDLRAWQVLPPITLPSRRFAWAEVVSVVRVEGRWALVFCCLADHMPLDRPGAGGVWSLAVPDAVWSAPAGAEPALDLDLARRVTTEQLYAGRLVALAEDDVRLLAFRIQDDAGRFVGGLVDPQPVAWDADGLGLRLTGSPAAWVPADARPAPDREADGG